MPQHSKSKSEVVLHPFNGSEILSISDEESLTRLWFSLRCTAVEAAQAPSPDFYVFLQNCFYVATICIEPISQEVEDDSQAEPELSPHSDFSLPISDGTSLLTDPGSRTSNKPSNPLPTGTYLQRESEEILADRSKPSALKSGSLHDMRPSIIKRDAAKEEWIYDPSNDYSEVLQSRNSDQSPHRASSSDTDRIRYTWPDLGSGDEINPSAPMGPTPYLYFEGLDEEMQKLRERREALLQIEARRSSLSPPKHTVPDPRTPVGPVSNKMIGIIYLASWSQDAMVPGEINLGLALKEPYQEKEYGPQAVMKVLKWAFDELQFHRVQAVVMESPTKPHALKMFTKLGFVHEGTRRRSVADPSDGGWKDATYLAVLDTDWAMRSSSQPQQRSLWDEMFLRHQREREDLLKYDQKRVKRTTSMETIRQPVVKSAAERLVDNLWSEVSDKKHISTHAGSSTGQERNIYRTPSPAMDTSDSCSEYSSSSSFSGSTRDDSVPPNESSTIFSWQPSGDAYSTQRSISGSPPPPSEMEIDESGRAGDDDTHGSPGASNDMPESLSIQALKRLRFTNRYHSNESDVDSNWDMLETTSELSFSLQSASDSE